MAQDTQAAVRPRESDTRGYESLAALGRCIRMSYTGMCILYIYIYIYMYIYIYIHIYIYIYIEREIL